MSWRAKIYLGTAIASLPFPWPIGIIALGAVTIWFGYQDWRTATMRGGGE